MIKISVALCTYNGSMFIKEQLNSIFKQSKQPDEIVLVDDCSTDETVDIINKCKKNWNGKFKLYRNDVNFGFQKNFQKALNLCTGDIIFLCDQDDIWEKDKIKIIVKEFSLHPDVSMIFHNDRLIDYEGKSLNATFWNDNLLNNYASIYDKKKYDYLLWCNIVRGAASAIRKDLIRNKMPFPKEFWHDEWLAILAALTGKNILALPYILSAYRIGSHQTLGNVSRKKMDRLSHYIFNLKNTLVKNTKEIHRRRNAFKNLNDWIKIEGWVYTSNIDYELLRWCSECWGKRDDSINKNDYMSLIKLWPFYRKFNSNFRSLIELSKDLAATFIL